VAAIVAYAIRRFSLTGDRAFALYAALYAASRCVTELMRIDYATRIFGVRANLLMMIAVLIIACLYLVFARRRSRRGPAPEEPSNRPRPLRPRSTSAASGDLDLPAAQAQK
jgi:prolipoprotein diacylglyceryltransferase